MSTISRRAFLKTVGVGALSVAAMSVLAGCDVAGTTTETPSVVTAVEGKVGSMYPVSDLITVTVEDDSKVAFTNNWAKAYVDAYKNYTPSVTSTTSYDELNDAQKADVKEKAEKAASLADSDKAEVTFKFTMLETTPDPILLGSSGSDKDGYKSSYFTATANGTALECTINKVALTATTDDFKCTVKLPSNCKSFDLTIALPGTDKAVKYTFENKGTKGYLVIDPTDDDFYTDRT